MYDVIIVGAGLAGCSSAIHLAKRGFSVLLLEKGRYPAHKICGEFLSTEVGEMLNSLGVYDDTRQHGAATISSVMITAPESPPWNAKLPGTALGVSRYFLDKRLFDQCSREGVKALEAANVLTVNGGLRYGFTVQSSAGNYSARMVLGSYGKRSSLDSKIGRNPQSWGLAYAAFKQHYTGAGPGGVVEVHTFDRGYCGVNSVEQGLVNVCWLVQKSLLDEYGGDRKAIVSNVFPTNPYLQQRLTALEPISSSFCATGVATLDRKGIFHDDVCMIGDSAQMIAPFCGDGMAMALKSGELIANLSALYLDGTVSASRFRALYSSAWKSNFGTRLALGKFIQSVALDPANAHVALQLLSLFPKLGEFIISATRGRSQPYATNSNSEPSMVSPGPNASATAKV